MMDENFCEHYINNNLQEFKMIREEFISTMQSNKGCAVIMAGSDSDKGHIDKLVKSLQKYGIVGRFIAQMCAGVNPTFREMLEKESVRKVTSLEQADIDFQNSYGGNK